MPDGWSLNLLCGCSGGGESGRLPGLCGVNPMGEWISVKDRLPESGEVIAFAAEYSEYLIGWLAETEDEDRGVVCYGDGVEMWLVTHWMPLPEPPKED